MHYLNELLTTQPQSLYLAIASTAPRPHPAALPVSARGAVVWVHALCTQKRHNPGAPNNDARRVDHGHAQETCIDTCMLDMGQALNDH